MEAKPIGRATQPVLPQPVDRIKAQLIIRVPTAFRKTNKIIVKLKNRVTRMKLTKGAMIMIEAVFNKNLALEISSNLHQRKIKLIVIGVETVTETLKGHHKMVLEFFNLIDRLR